jgi:phosphatidate cytidylyltransferase
MTETDTAAPAPQSETRWADLGVRALTAALLIPAVLLDIWMGGVWFELFAAFLGLLIAHEWINIAHSRSSTQFALHAAAALCAAFLPKEIGVLQTMGIAAFLTALGIIAAAYRQREHVIWSYVGVPYVTVAVLSLVLLRNHSAWGIHAIMWLMFVVWATDSFAYFAGRIIGGPKLAPRWSPKKTWAGLIGGMVGAAAISGVYAAFYAPNIWPLLLVAAILAALAQVGDIFESALKRHFNVKDSGYLIPGHGGVMDRVDGLVFAGAGAAAIGFAREAGEVAQGLMVW